MKYLKFASVFSVILLLAGCFGGKEDAPSMMVINVLDKALYDDCHIKGSIHIPMMEVKEKAKNWPKTTKIVVYCSNYMCTASTTVAKQLGKMGFEQVWDYDDGMAGWYQAQLPVEGPCKEAYLTAQNMKFPGATHPEGVTMIDTQGLKKLLEENGFLK